MTASSANQLPSFAAAASSNVFTFTANVEAISVDVGQLNKGTDDSSIITKTSEASIVPLRLMFNAAAPANHLPTELVVKILTSGAWSHWSELIALTHICQHWRNVALGTPQLWADATHSAFADEGWQYYYRCLPTFLARSEPCLLTADLRCLESFTLDLDPEDPEDDSMLQSHLPRVTHLSAQLMNITEFGRFVGRGALRLRNIESLHMPQIKRTFTGILLIIDINKLRFWRDTDFPRLRTLTLSAYCFMRPIAVTSLRDLVLYDEPRSCDEFLSALERCAHGLESLTLRAWSHPWYGSWERNPGTRTVQLPNLRHFRVSLDRQAQSPAPLAFLFASLSFPANVSIHLDWKCNPRITRELLPKDLVGLHAPPFFDSMCFHLYTLPNTVTLYCYVNDTEHLTVRENPLLGSLCSESGWGNGRCFNEFLDEHRYTTVTQLAIDFDMKLRDGDEPFASADLLQKYVGVHPLLRRLDLFGKAIGNIQLSVAETFLSLPEPDGTQGAPGKTLGYVCKVAEHVKSANKAAHLDNVCAELDNLEQVLKSHEAAGGAGLHRLGALCCVLRARLP